MHSGRSVIETAARVLLAAAGLAFAAYNLFFALLSTAFPADLRRTAAERAWLWVFGVLSLVYVAFIGRRRPGWAGAALILLGLVTLWLLTGFALDRLSLIKK